MFVARAIAIWMKSLVSSVMRRKRRGEVQCGVARQVDSHELILSHKPMSCLSPPHAMSNAPLPVIEVKPLPKGTPAFEAKRHALRQELAGRIPDSLRLPPHLLRDPPKNVMRIPPTCGLLSDKEVEITEKYDAVSLVTLIAQRKLTSADVVTAFAKRAAIAHQLTCCLTDFFLDEALERAQALDQHLASTGTVVGPLHGLPISLKELFDLAGHPSSTGYIGDIRHATTDSHLVSALRRLGAVFYVKTAQPQGIMHLEGAGYLYRVLNPYNIHLSAGGSSSGEAALLALRGSVLGVGTDIGGSVRGPAAFCGLWGYKPTSRLFPRAGVQTHRFTAALHIDSTCGPMGMSLGDLSLFNASVTSTEPHKEDCELKPCQWKPCATPSSSKLRVGIMMDDGHVVPQPPVTRALEWASAKLHLASDRIELVPYHPHKAAESFDMLKKWYWPIGTHAIRTLLAEHGEPEYPLTTANFHGVQDRQLVATEVLALHTSLSVFRREFIQDWHRQGVDVVLCPCYVGPASMHDTADYWTYTSLWNVVNFPGVAFPTPIKADMKTQTYADPQRAAGLSIRSARVKALWDEGEYDEAPIDLQLVAPHCCDVELWQAMQVVAGALGVA